MFRYGISAGMDDLPAKQPVTLRGDMETICRQAKEIGYDAVELHVREPGRYDPALLRATAEKFGLKICAVANGMEYTVNGLCLIDPNEDARRAAFDRFIQHVDFCGELGAMCVSGIMRGNIPPSADREAVMRRFTDSTRKICEYAAKKHVRVVIESIMRYINNYLNSVPETIDWVVSTGIDNLGLHLDTHSMAVEERDPAASIRYCQGKPLGYVHYSDNNRMYPGGGAVDFKALTRALVDIGYDGYITQESTALPSPYESARRGYEYMTSIEKAARIEALPY
jgi:Sugar phosphate isomerases/epimerases